MIDSGPAAHLRGLHRPVRGRRHRLLLRLADEAAGQRSPRCRTSSPSTRCASRSASSARSSRGTGRRPRAAMATFALARRQQRGAQAGRADADERRAHRRAGARGGHPARRLQRRPGHRARPSAPALVAHPEVDAISFTGSGATGRAIQAAAAARVKRVSPRARRQEPVDHLPRRRPRRRVGRGDDRACGARRARCAPAARACSSTRASTTRWSSGSSSGSRGMRIGGGFDPEAEMGPLVSADQLERVQRYVPIGRDEGAELALGGERHGERGYFHEPTVFTGVRNDMTIAQEEIFGPVMSILQFSTEEEAYRIANDVEYGLAAGVWTNDLAPRAPRQPALRVGHGLGQHLPDGLPVGALRRRQAVRPRPQPRRGVARRVHADQERLDEGELTRWSDHRAQRRSRRAPRAPGPHRRSPTSLYRYASTIDRFDCAGLRATARRRPLGAVRQRRPGRGRRRRRGVDPRGDRRRSSGSTTS